MMDQFPIGLIAGNGKFPILIAKAAQKEGKKLVVVIGQRKALRMAVSNNRTQRRYSRLLEALRPPDGTSIPEETALR